MERFDWPGLMQFGLVGLRLEPDVFWSLTPAELMLLTGGKGARSTMDRSALDALIKAFPDEHGDDG